MTSAAPFDLFLSYNHADEQAVRKIRKRLAARGVRSFIDQDDLNAGKAWPAELERALQNSRAVAVFVGRTGYGRWQQREIQYSLVLQTESNGKLAVIPVILEGAELPAGFIALNTWVDMRGGIDDASIERLVRAIDMSGAASTPPADITPYRRLDAFREEDASLLFGRQRAIDAVVSRIDDASGWDDRPRFVTVTGPSGSGKSSVVSAGVLPQIRSRRPPRLVWDAVVMQPRRHPWLSLASVFVALLEPRFSEIDRIRASGRLAEALLAPGGIMNTIERILRKSRGTDRLLVVVDQFEELFTLTEDSVAREFVRALLEASRNAPFCVLATLRSDYYGKAIALDRDLSDALPSGQVNLGPMRREELRDVIVRPAMMVKLTFDAALVDRILDDVGDEPGNLPLLEYSLSELWDLRAQDRLTFSGYQEIGGVSGALTRRAESIYGELSDAQKEATRRLMMRLVRVSPADEEGADTRRRARRDEIGEEDWKLVQAFAGERARLVVAAKDTVSGEDGVEVAHEALIRRWQRLREWLNDDREFLLWRQDLALYRAGSPDGIPQGALLKKASRWLQERGGELNSAERQYIEKSVTVSVRARRMRTSLVAGAVILVAFLAGGITYTRTARYDVQTILARNPEEQIKSESQSFEPYDTNVAWMMTLLRLGRYDDVRRGIAAQAESGERAQQLARLAVAMRGTAPNRSEMILKEAIAEAKRANYALPWQTTLFARIAKAAARAGDKKTAVKLLEAADKLLPSDDAMFADGMIIGYVRGYHRKEVADAWKVVGKPEHARQILKPVLNLPAERENIDLLTVAVEEVVVVGETDLARKLPKFSGGDDDARRFYELMRVTAYATAGDLDKAQEIAARLPKAVGERALAIIARIDFNRHPDLSRTAALVRSAEYSADTVLLDSVIGELVRLKRDREVEQLIAQPKRESARRDMRELFVQHLIGAGRLDDAARVAELLKGHDPDNEPRPLPFARLGVAFARIGRRTEAENALRYAASHMPPLWSESARDDVNAVRASAEAILGRIHEARLIADGIEQDRRQWEAYFEILNAYVKQKERP